MHWKKSRHKMKKKEEGKKGKERDGQTKRESESREKKETGTEEVSIRRKRQSREPQTESKDIPGG